MDDEAAFLRTIQANPKDDAPRLVYADWLDERGDEHSIHKAAFLRITARLLTARSHLGRKYWEDKLRAAATGLEAHWLAAVSRVPIEGCSFLFAFRCPERWEKLRVTANPNVRQCDTCGKPVYFSATIDEAREHARGGHCVALSLAVPRSTGDLSAISTGRRFTPDQIRALGEGIMLGRVQPHATVAEPTPTEGPRPPATALDRDAPRRRVRKPEPTRKRPRRYRVDED